jgi:hypothetical protein
MRSSTSVMELAMPIETALTLAAIVAVFATFGIVLASVAYYTGKSSRS